MVKGLQSDDHRLRHSPRPDISLIVSALRAFASNSIDYRALTGPAMIVPALWAFGCGPSPLWGLMVSGRKRLLQIAKPIEV